MELKNSETKNNLMRAFAGESQARNRYTFAASVAREQGLYVIEAIFNYTAGQEKEHAEVFYNYLSSLAGETIQVDGTYPVDINSSVAQLLRYAEHNEYEEYNDAYKSFGDTAKSEGFTDIANTFYSIAEIEKTHGDRFGCFADLLESGRLFVCQAECEWVCLNCGHIHNGEKAPEACPVCHHDKGYFIRLTMAPWKCD
ncbi:MAG: rubrerythrin family protein [Clostridia bacterium]|nr:rubrerythrin family protein [Clostridia bacterium]